MFRYKITIEYDGTGFCGWQWQKNGISIQSVIQEAIFRFCNQHVEVFASGRTDAGVHAFGQVAHFDLAEQRCEDEVLRAINYHLRPHRICIINCENVSSDFHARFSCIERSYKYIILNRKAPTAINLNRVWHVHILLNLNEMIKASEFFIGTHDFSSFRASQCQGKSPVKTINKLEITKDNDLIEINISAKSFLHHMVRNITGTLVEVGKGKREAADISRIIERRERRYAGVTAPACGLYFFSARYF